MNKIERITTALRGGVPDMVPYIYNTVDRSVQERILGRAIDLPLLDGLNVTGWLGGFDEKPEVVPALTIAPEVAGLLGMDAIQIQLLPPLFVKKVIVGGDACISGGLIDSADALRSIKMPDPDDETLLRQVEDMINRYKGDFALGARVRLGAAPAILSLGMENLSYFIYDGEEDIVHETIALYASWSKRFNKNLSELDFDFFWAFDDIAYNTGPMFSPAIFKKFFKEPLKDAASSINKPWIFHSDGNYKLFLDDIVDIGASAIHPIERESMDHLWLKANYGDKLCLVGNIDINYTLSSGSPEEVEAEVKARIDELSPGGAYIIADSNSVPAFCKAENIIAMSKAVQKYRRAY